MARYFFHTTGRLTFRDNEGTDLSGPDEARVEAVKFAANTVRDHPDLVDQQEFIVEVTDETREIVLSVVIFAVGGALSHYGPEWLALARPAAIAHQK